MRVLLIKSEGLWWRNDADEPTLCLAANCKAQLSAGRFQESAMFSLRNSVGVKPVAALKARLKGPMD
jgi:hypothetical protein